jgi:hypothetical protein
MESHQETETTADTTRLLVNGTGTFPEVKKKRKKKILLRVSPKFLRYIYSISVLMELLSMMGFRR